MKDEKLFLETDFTLVDLTKIKYQLQLNGWIIESLNNNVSIYESKDDFDWNDPMCEKSDDTYEKSFLYCLLEIQKY